MPESPRKKSPRAPSLPLNEAIERAIGVYEKEQRHPAPTDVVAQDLGYKSANNGTALAVIASLRYYGLLERPEPGKLAASGELQSYHYAPDEDLKQELVRAWLRNPPVFAELLDRYDSSLPSDATIRHDLIQQGFKPASAESVLKSFKESVEFAEYYSGQDKNDGHQADSEANNDDVAEAPHNEPDVAKESSPVGIAVSSNDADRIPVRLDANRRAWLEIPAPFYEADKKRLKAQIDLLLTDDEDDILE